MKIGQFTLLSAFLFFNLNAGTIKGKVTLGNEYSTVSGVTIHLTDKKLRFSTDENGLYAIPNLTKGLYSLEVVQIGYKRKFVENISVDDAEETEINVHLEESPFLLNEVVVTGTFQKHLFKETPVITEVISSKDLQRSGSSEISEVLRTQTGIEIGTGIGQTQNVSLQGLRSHQVLVLVDGERVSGKIDDALDINQIPIQSIERIEIVKGPMSSMYGSDAIGGVINIITKEPQNGTTVIDAAITGGSNGRQDYTLLLSHGVPDIFGERSSLNFLLSGGLNKYFGIDYDESDFMSEMPEFDRKNLSFKIAGNSTDRFKFDLKGDYYQDELEWLAGGDQYVHFVDFGNNKKYSFVGSGQYTFGGATILKASGNYSTNDHGSSEKTGAGYLVRNSVTTEQIQTARLQLTTIPYNTSTLTMGVETNDEQVTSQRVLDGRKRIVNNILYGEDEWAIGDFTFNAGARYSNHSRFGDFFAPRFSTLFRPTEQLTLRASYGRGFRSPSINELFLDFNHVSIGYTVQGNQNLQPESSHGYNVGFDYARDEIVWFRINGYYNDVTNLINYYYVSVSPVVFSYRNISSATAKGIDVDIDMNPISIIHAAVGYNFNETTDEHGKLLPFHSKHTVNSKLTIDIPAIDGSIFVRYRWYDKQPVVDEQTNTSAYGGETVSPTYYYSPAYTIVDVNCTSRIFTLFDITAGVNNLFDKITYPFGQTKGREFFAGIRFQLQP
ncbi:MAG: TonB-dependent receptor [Ignavibacteriales bacterium]|nr:TonB-dependent receptor [Ignavibacteriales bacterium]